MQEAGRDDGPPLLVTFLPATVCPYVPIREFCFQVCRYHAMDCSAAPVGTAARCSVAEDRMTDDQRPETFWVLSRCPAGRGMYWSAAYTVSVQVRGRFVPVDPTRADRSSVHAACPGSLPAVPHFHGFPSAYILCPGSVPEHVHGLSPVCAVQRSPCGDHPIHVVLFHPDSVPSPQS